MIGEDGRQIEARDIGVKGYRVAGPTLARLHGSTAMERLVAGPIGSGKTTAACWDVGPFTAMLQSPGPDGVRRAKVGILRDTYRNLYGTTLETWFKSFPRYLGEFVGSDDRPFKHSLVFPAPYIDQKTGQPTREMGLCELIVEGRALGAHSVEATARGWELMAAYVDEIDLTPEETCAYLRGRTMRGGEKAYRVSRGVIGTFNKPDVDHYLYRMCEEERPSHRANSREYFDQPPGLLPGEPYRTNPEAEGLQYLDDDYYPKSARGNAEWYVRRMLRNQWGSSVSGERIYPAFRRELHVQRGLEPRPRAEISIGIDGGGTPAAVFVGRAPETGRRIVYGELVITDPGDPRKRRLLHGVGPRRFGELLRDYIAYRFPNQLIRIGWCDPAAFFGADREMGEYAWPETVQQVAGIPIQPSPSNEINLRLDSVKGLLHRGNLIDGLPDLIVDERCSFLIRGFDSDYKYEQHDPKQAGKTLKPQKTATSHVHDALQYDCLGDQGRAGVTGGQKYDRFQPPKLMGGLPGPDLGGAPAMPWQRGEAAQTYGEGAGESYKSDWSPWK